MSTSDSEKPSGTIATVPDKIVQGIPVERCISNVDMNKLKSSLLKFNVDEELKSTINKMTLDDLPNIVEDIITKTIPNKTEIDIIIKTINKIINNLENQLNY